jgi:crossover junction endodeoxyribonuclease RusA
MRRSLSFTVYGEAAPQGSKTVGRTKSGRSFVREASKRTKPWRGEVQQAAGRAVEEAGWELARGPVRLDLSFHFPRPKSHLSSSKSRPGALLPSAPEYHTKKPDVLKVTRAVEDAMAGIVYLDDSQIVIELATKAYAAPDEPARVEINVTAMEE